MSELMTMPVRDVIAYMHRTGKRPTGLPRVLRPYRVRTFAETEEVLDGCWDDGMTVADMLAEWRDTLVEDLLERLTPREEAMLWGAQEAA